MSDKHAAAIAAAAETTAKAKDAETGGKVDTSLLKRFQENPLPFAFGPDNLHDHEVDATLLDENGQLTIDPRAHKCMILHLQGFNFAEISRLTNIAAGTIASWIRSPEIQRRIAKIMTVVEYELSSMTVLASQRLRNALTCGSTKEELEAVRLVFQANGKLSKKEASGESAEDMIRDIMAVLEQSTQDADGNVHSKRAAIRLIDSRGRNQTIDTTPIGDEPEEKSRLE